MTALEAIKANTCPYCGAAYTLAAGGCVAQCPTMAYVHHLIDEAAHADELQEPGDSHEPNTR